MCVAARGSCLCLQRTLFGRWTRTRLFHMCLLFVMLCETVRALQQMQHLWQHLLKCTYRCVHVLSQMSENQSRFLSDDVSKPAAVCLTWKQKPVLCHNMNEPVVDLHLPTCLCLSGPSPQMMMHSFFF